MLKESTLREVSASGVKTQQGRRQEAGSSWGLSTTHIAFPAWRVMLHWLDTGRTFLCRGLALEIP